MGGWETHRSWGNEGGNERESRDGESKIEYSESGEVKSGREKKGGRGWKTVLEISSVQ